MRNQLPDFSKIQGESRQHGIAADRSRIVEALGRGAGTIDDDLELDAIDQQAELCSVGDVLPSSWFLSRRSRRSANEVQQQNRDKWVRNAAGLRRQGHPIACGGSTTHPANAWRRSAKGNRWKNRKRCRRRPESSTSGFESSIPYFGSLSGYPSVT